MGAQNIEMWSKSKACGTCRGNIQEKPCTGTTNISVFILL